MRSSSSMVVRMIQQYCLGFLTHDELGTCRVQFLSLQSSLFRAVCPEQPLQSSLFRAGSSEQQHQKGECHLVLLAQKQLRATKSFLELVIDLTANPLQKAPPPIKKSAASLYISLLCMTTVLTCAQFRHDTSLL